MESDGGKRGKRISKCSSWYLVVLMAMAYGVGELSHFLVGIISRSMSQELQYGDQSCLSNSTSPGNITCSDLTSEETYCYATFCKVFHSLVFAYRIFATLDACRVIPANGTTMAWASVTIPSQRSQLRVCNNNNMPISRLRISDLSRTELHICLHHRRAAARRPG